MLRHWTTFIHYYLGLKSSTKIPDHYHYRRDGNFNHPLNYGDSTQKIDAKTLQKDSIIVVTSLALSQGRTLILSGWGVFGQSSLEFPTNLMTVEGERVLGILYY